MHVFDWYQNQWPWITLKSVMTSDAGYLCGSWASCHICCCVYAQRLDDQTIITDKLSPTVLVFRSPRNRLYAAVCSLIWVEFQMRICTLLNTLICWGTEELAAMKLTKLYVAVLQTTSHHGFHWLVSKYRRSISALAHLLHLRIWAI